MITTLPFTADELTAAVTEVLTMLGTPGPVAHEHLTERTHFAAKVFVHGEGTIELLVAAPPAVAAELAAGFFGTVSEEVDMIDAMGELANICGGAVKPFMPGTWVIGIPERDNPAMEATENILEAIVAFGSGPIGIAVAPAVDQTSSVEPAAIGD